MVDAIGRRERSIRGGARGTHGERFRDANVDRVNFSVVRGRSETQIVFVADELSDLGENLSKILVRFGKIGAAAVGLRDGL